jgi:site-specific recombinase XerD
MTRRSREPLLALVQSYFDEYLRRVRGASDHTMRTYGNALRLFFLFLADHTGRRVSALRLDDIRAEAVLAFLNHLESSRGNTVATRNSRLAAIRGFVEYLLRHEVTRGEQYGRILAIPAKRTAPRVVSYLEPEEARAVIAAVDPKTRAATRDRALLLLLYNTGARVSEALAVRPRDLRLERPRQIRLYGKGGKERLCPLWPETGAALRKLLRTEATSVDERIFRNARGAPLTRDGVAYILDKYIRGAASNIPSLRRRHVTPHALRHSCAVALLQAGVDVTVIRDYLGHATVATTSRYITSNLQMKRVALDAFWKRAGLEPGPCTRWRPSPKLLAFLVSL